MAVVLGIYLVGDFIVRLRKIRVKVFKVASTYKPKFKKQNSNIFKESDGNKKLMPVLNNLVGTQDQNGADKEAQEKIYEKDKCVICFDNPVQALNKPCNHSGFCKSCSFENYDTSKKCPLCRENISHIVIFEKRDDGRYYQIEQYPDNIYHQQSIL